MRLFSGTQVRSKGTCPAGTQVQPPTIDWRHHTIVGAILLLSLLLTPQSWASEKVEDESLEFLKSLSIEELLQTEVTSVSKKSEQLFNTAAAVFVISQEDIKRTGVRSIPDALRMVPGLQVAHIDGSKFAITSRGFNDWFSNKLLVLIDGRSVYTPLFSGVYWDMQDTVLEDVERIEVIRGPGATMWGANAVNGVISIITKKASDTQGGLLVGGVGNIEKPYGIARYGGKIGDDAAYRLFAKGFYRDNFQTSDGGEASDAWSSVRSGFRVDWTVSARDNITVQGETFGGEGDFDLTLSGFITPPFTRQSEEKLIFHGGNLMTTWEREISDRSDLMVKACYDWTFRDQVIIEEQHDTLDLEFKHHWKANRHHEVVWGLGYRRTADETTPSANLWMDPDSREDQLLSAFVQDDIMLRPGTVWLTLGSKFEQNDYSGFEVQPNLRFRWKPTPLHTVWAAASNAVRAPSRSDHDISVNLSSMQDPFGDISVFRIQGDDDFESEDLTALEIGVRWQPDHRFSVDLTGFYNIYDNLRIVEAGTPFIELSPGPPHMVIPMIVTNGMQGITYGFEALTTWKPVDFWKLSFGYAWLDIDLDADGNPGEEEAEYSPEHQIQVRSYLDLPNALSLDTELYFVDDLPGLDLPSYTRMDLRLGWDPAERWSFSLNIENLLDDRHPEFPARSGIGASEVPRTIYGQVRYCF